MTKAFLKILIATIIGSFVIPYLLPIETFLQTKTAQAVTGVPEIISYQGRLTNAAGVLQTGSFDFKFSIYTDATVGAPDTQLWPAGAPTLITLVVSDGVFNVNIGDTANGYPDALTYNFQDNDTVFLQVEVYNTSTTSWETLSPRQQINSSGYAINAGSVLGRIPGTGANNILLLDGSGNIALAGSIDTASTLQAGSSNVTLTLATGFIDADAITLTSAGGAGVTFSNSGLETVSDGLTLLKGCSDGQILKWDDVTDIRWECSADVSGGAASLQAAYDGGNTLNTSDARDIDIVLDDDTTDSNLDIDIVADNTVAISRLDNANAEAPSQLLLLDNLDADLTVTGGLVINVATGGAITTALDVSDAEIATAIAIGSNDVTVGGATISSSEFAILDNNIALGGAEVTGVLTLDKGGTNNNITASNGAIVYSDADSFELSAVGTSGQALVSGGAGAPTWFVPTAGSVLFAGASGILQQDNSNFFWDDSTDDLGLGDNTPDAKLDIETSVARTEDLVTLTSSGATVTDAIDALSIAFTQGNDADATDTNAGINLLVTGDSAGDADTLYGINFANLAGAGDAAPVTRALSIGSSWDSNLFFADTTTQIQVSDTGTIVFEDDAGNDLLSLADAGAIVVGSAGNTAVTITTDSTGNAELVVPGDSIGVSEIDEPTALGAGDDEECLTYENGTGAFEFQDCSAGVAWNEIGDASGNGAIEFASTTQTLDWTDSATDGSYFSFNFDNNDASAGTDNFVVINNALSTNTGAVDLNTEALLLLDNVDTSASGSTIVDNAILITNSGGITSGIVDAIDASATEIDNAINIGANTILGTTAVINFTDFDVDSDGKVTLAPDTDGTSFSLINTSAITSDLAVISGQFTNTVTTGVDALYIDLSQGDDADATDTNAVINLDFISTSDNADTAIGINIQNGPEGLAPTPISKAIQIGNDWDSNLFFADTTTQIQVSDTGVITFEDDAGNDLVTIADAGANGTVTANSFVGALTGNATTATALAADPTDCAANQFANAIVASGNLTCAAITDADVPNSVTIDLATLASTVTVVDSTDATSFIAMFDSATGSLAAKTDGGLTYDATTGTLTATAFVGPLTGSATDLNCTDCIGTTEIADVYLLNTGDSGSGNYSWVGIHDWTNTLINTSSLGDFNLTLGNDGGADTISAINIDVTSGATGDVDIVAAINIASLTSADGTVIERALQIGDSWDSNLFFADTSTQIQVSNTGTIVFEDDAGNDLLSLADAGAIVVGSAGNTAVTITTDSTGNAELVVPGDSIGVTEIDENGDTPVDEDCLTFEDNGAGADSFEFQACGGGSTSLQTAYNTATIGLIETDATNPILFTETTAENHGTVDLLQLTVNQATGGLFGGDILQITQDGVDANAFTGNGLKF